ncbi:MAG: type II secretion system protein [Candidatus Taylorbacteria bacterium]|nr:type II secretion system protein [Candidatus Taylorbacteria bacterium]
MKNKKRGFTLLEVLIVIGIIAILSSVALVAVNPARQFKLARDAQRMSNVSAIVNAVSQNMSENQGILVCRGNQTMLPSTSTPIKFPGGFDLATCIVPDYISVVPFDPSLPGAHFATTTDYDTGYVIYQDSRGRITASSTGEINPSITAVR